MGLEACLEDRMLYVGLGRDYERAVLKRCRAGLCACGPLLPFIRRFFIREEGWDQDWNGTFCPEKKAKNAHLD